MISSYYSPLPGQEHYFTGTFEGDVRLNGEGVHTADGKLVFPGTAAASKQYPFGTKMEVPGVGIIGIHDRGGAIRGDRLDLWVGTGEEGLRRALGWGMRTVTVTVYGQNPDMKESVSFDGIPLANISGLQVKTVYFKSDLGLGDQGQAVSELQRLLKSLGYFSGEVSGYFNEETQSDVRTFQLAEKVISDVGDTGAGNFGPKTRVTFESALQKQKAQWKALLPVGTIEKGSTGEAVTQLQQLLKRLGFTLSDSGNFDDATLQALRQFQINNGIIQSASEQGAGFYGPKTRSTLDSVINEKFTPYFVAAAPAPAFNDPTPPPAPKLFNKTLTLGDRGPEVELLQQELTRLSFLGLEPTSYFGEVTQHAVFKFQQAFGIVEDDESKGAGVVGPRTLDKLNSLAQARMKQIQEISKATEDKEILQSRLEDEKLLVAGVVQDPSKAAFSTDLSYGMRGGEVKNLQRILKRLGFFPGRITTEYYGEITKNSVTAFQKAHLLDESGQLDERARRILNNLMDATS